MDGSTAVTVAEAGQAALIAIAVLALLALGLWRLYNFGYQYYRTDRFPELMKRAGMTEEDAEKICTDEFAREYNRAQAMNSSLFY